MRDVAIVAFAQSPAVRAARGLSDVEMLHPVIQRARQLAGPAAEKVGFTCSGSCDFLAGLPFSFVGALDAVGAWPPISESHVEMDGAWALYEAWVRLQHGDIEAALVYSFGKSSSGSIRDVLTQQMDPYYVAPLHLDSVAMAAMQARAVLDTTRYTERDFAVVAARNRRDAMSNPNAQVARADDVDAMLDAPYIANPLRLHDCPPISDGAAAIILATGDLARRATANPAWIRGIDHRIEAHGLGVRDLTSSPSTRLAAERAGAFSETIEVAELHAPFSHQELILKDALTLPDSVSINPSGGALAANAIMVAGLVRIGEAAQQIIDGKARRTLAHATSGPCLQQNMVCVMEASK